MVSYLDGRNTIPTDIHYVVTNIGVTGVHGAFIPEANQVKIQAGLCDRDTIKAVCHETHHVYQIRDQRLIVEKDKVLWEDNNVTNLIGHINSQDYPWEVEARQQEQLLTEGFLNARTNF